MPLSSHPLPLTLPLPISFFNIFSFLLLPSTLTLSQRRAEYLELRLPMLDEIFGDTIKAGDGCKVCATGSTRAHTLKNFGCEVLAAWCGMPVVEVVVLNA